MDDFIDLLGREFFGTQIGINVRLLKDALGRAQSDPINVSERRFDAFVGLESQLQVIVAYNEMSILG